MWFVLKVERAFHFFFFFSSVFQPNFCFVHRDGKTFLASKEEKGNRQKSIAFQYISVEIFLSGSFYFIGMKQTQKIARFKFEHVRQFFPLPYFVGAVLDIDVIFIFVYIFIRRFPFISLFSRRTVYTTLPIAFCLCYNGIDERVPLSGSEREKLSMPRLIDSLHLILSSTFLLACFPSFVHFLLAFVRRYLACATSTPLIDTHFLRHVLPSIVQLICCHAKHTHMHTYTHTLILFIEAISCGWPVASAQFLIDKSMLQLLLPSPSLPPPPSTMFLLLAWSTSSSPLPLLLSLSSSSSLSSIRFDLISTSCQVNPMIQHSQSYWPSKFLLCVRVCWHVVRGLLCYCRFSLILSTLNFLSHAASVFGECVLVLSW